MGFEVIRGEIAEGRMPALGVVIGETMADFQPRFREIAEAAAGEQFGFEAAPKRFSVGVILAVAAAAHALHGLVTSYYGLKVGGRTLTTLVGMD